MQSAPFSLKKPAKSGLPLITEPSMNFYKAIRDGLVCFYCFLCRIKKNVRVFLFETLLKFMFCWMYITCYCDLTNRSSQSSADALIYGR